MKSKLAHSTAVLTALLLGACATTAPRRAQIVAADPCEPKIVGTHCISGEELTRYGSMNNAEALRMAFPWFH